MSIPNVNLLAKMDKPQEKITFTLSPLAQSILGTDDPLLVSEAYPSLEFVQVVRGQHIYRAARIDVRTLCYDLDERSKGGERGFMHTATERYCAARHARKLFIQLYGEGALK